MKFDKAVDRIAQAAGGLFDATNMKTKGMRLDSVVKTIFGGPFTANVLLDYPWMEDGILTQNEKKNIPYVHLKEYEITENGLYSTLNYYTWQSEEVNKENGNPYRGLYAGKKTGMQYYFPYIAQFSSSTSTGWEVAENISDRVGLSSSSLGIFGEAATNIADGISSATKLAGALNTMKKRFSDKNNIATLKPISPFIWKSSEGKPISISFYLFNTNSGPSAWVRNWKLITYLRMAVTFNQINTLFATPPAIYTVTIPSIMHIPAAYISELTVNQCGNCILFSLGNTSNGSDAITTFQDGVGAENFGPNGMAETFGTNGMAETFGPNGVAEALAMGGGNAEIFGGGNAETFGAGNAETFGGVVPNPSNVGDDSSAKSPAGSIKGPKNDVLIVPDAWEVQMTITPLISQSRQVIFNGILNGGNFDNVHAISQSDEDGNEVVDSYKFDFNTSTLPAKIIDKASQDMLENSIENTRSTFDNSAIPTNAEELL